MFCEDIKRACMHHAYVPSFIARAETVLVHAPAHSRGLISKPIALGGPVHTRVIYSLAYTEYLGQKLDKISQLYISWLHIREGIYED